MRRRWLMLLALLLTGIALPGLGVATLPGRGASVGHGCGCACETGGPGAGAACPLCVESPTDCCCDRAPADDRPQPWRAPSSAPDRPTLTEAGGAWSLVARAGSMPTFGERVRSLSASHRGRFGPCSTQAMLCVRTT